MERYEAPPPYDMTAESDMEFRSVVAAVFSQQSHAMAASVEPRSDFLLLNEIRRLTPPPGAGGGAIGVISPPAPADAISKPAPSERITQFLQHGMESVGVSNFQISVDALNGSFHVEGYGEIIMVRDMFPGKYASHENLYIENQKQDIGKWLMRNHVRLYERMKIRKIQLYANYAGRYAWAKYGFSPSENELKARFRALQELVGGNSRLVRPTPPRHIAQIAEVYVPTNMIGEFLRCCNDVGTYESAITDSEYRGKDGSFLLGKCFLLNGPVWRGELDLTSGLGRKVFDHYTGYRKQAMVMV